MFSSEIQQRAQKVIALYKSHKRKLAVAESCTGGLIAGALTDIPGSSAIFERGFVTYSNDAKIEVLAVRAETLQEFGAVSMETAEEMAQGALEFSRADACLSVTGIAGPDGGTAEKPLGLVYFGFATREGLVMHYKCSFKGDRESVRMQSVSEAFRLILTLTNNSSDIA